MKKRVLALVTATVMMVLMSASVCFADDPSPSLEITDSTPKAGDTGMSLDNLGVKLWFNEDMYSEEYNKANEKCFKITDADGKEIPIIVAFNKNKDQRNQVLVLEDTNSKYKVKQDTEYTLTISEDLVSAAGNTLSASALQNNKITFKTLNQKRTNGVNMAMMLVMMAVMMVATLRSQQKAAEEKEDQKYRHETVNPYKEAKKTGKSVEEIVAKDKEKKAKEAAKEAKKRAEYERRLAEYEKKQEEELQKILAASRKHVSRPRPISEAGSTYVTGRKAAAEKKAAEEAERRARGTTNPKNKKKGKKKK